MFEVAKTSLVQFVVANERHMDAESLTCYSEYTVSPQCVVILLIDHEGLESRVLTTGWRWLPCDVLEIICRSTRRLVPVNEALQHIIGCWKKAQQPRLVLVLLEMTRAA